jgi:hypothetical protein
LTEAVSDENALEQISSHAVSTAQRYTLAKVADTYLEDFQELVASEKRQV